MKGYSLALAFTASWWWLKASNLFKAVNRCLYS